ncbi:fungal-specific transcription factor domain-containing protein [Pseudomassariella vexata]|uniref:Fungal-specific transcription factor domain-domain-containing protein n=1 Tax=Pseudomassariella vexata TaxID=1141098 RepID=A0A1Y2EAF0_9PEZI|nr:fungal-specific transcription factor domain-containing protein [Pseudomassariella vexata]ORY68284.1 fungal-specific transcription factor domain-domain-containing protein [Pseudomassariella vexata]
MIHSATSSNDSWSTSYGEEADGDDAEHDTHWEQGSDDVLTVPKLEPLDEEDFHMNDVKEAPRTPRPASSLVSSATKTKRPRGRPRKHPLTPQVSTNKVAKGRSKTGCITCRKRKKKCDEAKPRCMNCEKNAVVCEGYHEKTLWKSGRERAEEERQKWQSLPVITLQPIFQGVDGPEDMVFLNHYINHLSGVLTVESQHKNAFKDMLLQMAVEHRGLMHSILSLASKHIDYDTPYGAKILSSNPKITPATLLARSEYHYTAAMDKLYEDIRREGIKEESENRVNLSVRYGQMLCLLIQSLAEGSHNGEHRVHLQAYKRLIQHSPPEDSAFLVFITEFFQFHIFADELIRHPDSLTARLATEEWEPWLAIQPARLIGVADGLFKYLTQITSIRNTIRTNMMNEIDPVVDYASLYRAAEIDAAIREWTPHWPPGDSRERAALLYKQMMWVYLFRTIYPPSSPTSSLLTSNLTLGAGCSPPLSPTSPAHSGHDPQCPDHPVTSHGHGHGHGYGHSHGHGHGHGSNSSYSCSPCRDSSPPPIRYPPHHDTRITVAVDESLAILDSFKPSDPVQTLLLIPCLVIGCACFAPSQQNRIRGAVRAVHGYTGLRNCDRALQVLEEVWRLMERGEWARVWDWQGVAKGLGLDFSCT